MAGLFRIIYDWLLRTFWYVHVPRMASQLYSFQMFDIGDHDGSLTIYAQVHGNGCDDHRLAECRQNVSVESTLGKNLSRLRS